MEVVATFREVTAVSVQDQIPAPEGKNEPSIILEAVRDWGEWDLALGEDAQQGYRANYIELDADSVVKFEGLAIRSIAKIDHSICVYFEYPTDIAVIDTEELVPVPFGSDQAPLSSILVSSLANFEEALDC